MSKFIYGMLWENDANFTILFAAELTLQINWGIQEW